MRSVFTQKCAGIIGSIGLFVALVAASGCNPDPVKGSGRGAHLFNYCAPCHSTDGHGHHRYGAPAIAGLSTWYIEAQLTKFKTGLRGAHPDDVEGLRMRPMMRVLKNDRDIKAIAKYVSALRPAHPEATLNGNARRGKQLYEVSCTATRSSGRHRCCAATTGICSSRCTNSRTRCAAFSSPQLCPMAVRVRARQCY